MQTDVLAWPKEKNAHANPFQKLLYSAVEKNHRFSVIEFTILEIFKGSDQRLLHIHWPDVYLANAKGARFWVKLGLLRCLFIIAGMRNIPVVWTAHNLKRAGQKNQAKMERWFWPWFADRIDAVIYMTTVSKAEAEQAFPNWKTIKSAVIPHGHYRPIIDALAAELTARPAPASDILFFGSITRYKNAYQVLDAFLSMPSEGTRLAIRGKMSKTEPDLKLESMLKSLSPEQAKNVLFEDRFLDDSELVDAISGTDLVVFPYSDVLNSGAAIFALSVGRPILASNNALFRELQAQVGGDWVRLIDAELDAPQLAAALTHAQGLKASGQRPDLSAFDWDVIADKTTAFYTSLLAPSKEHRP